MMPPSRRPCVLMTCDAVGGVWAYAGTLARALARQGWSVHLVVMGPPADLQQIDLLRGRRDHPVAGQVEKRFVADSLSKIVLFLELRRVSWIIGFHLPLLPDAE